MVFKRCVLPTPGSPWTKRGLNLLPGSKTTFFAAVIARLLETPTKRSSKTERSAKTFFSVDFSSTGETDSTGEALKGTSFLSFLSKTKTQSSEPEMSL